MIIDIAQRCADAAGGQASLARALGITPPALHSWTRVPAEKVRAVEKITGIPKHELRPDLWSA